MFPGDVVPTWKVRQFNAKPLQTLPLEKAIGKRLKEYVPGVKKGSRITQNDADVLSGQSIKEVRVAVDPIEATPLIKGVNMLPLIKGDDNWMAKMDFRRLKDVIADGALNAQWSELHSTNPIPAIAQGAEFGLGESGRY